MTSLTAERRELRVTSEPDVSTSPGGERERLDHFLGRQWEDLSRSRIEALIREGAVLVDGKRPKPSQAARPGQQIVLIIPAPEEPSAEPEALPLDIVFEDEDLIVVNKAPGMVVHPAPGHPSGTLVNALLHHCGDLSGIGGVLRPGIVHRLDKETSGLLVVAKSQQAHMGLAEAMKSREIERVYLALVWGRPDSQEGSIETWIGRSRSDRKRMAAYSERRGPLKRRWGRPAEEEEIADVRAAIEAEGELENEVEMGGPAEPVPKGVPADARRAVTHYVTSEAFDLTSLLECSLETGRTHQVRVHLRHVGHSVVGDPVYGGRESAVKGMAPEKRALASEILTRLSRQALHATRLRFRHPVSGEMVGLEQEPPDDLQGLLSFLRGSQGEGQR
ncbi:MAG: RluA family pseudouridine synthase [bacterium]